MLLEIFMQHTLKVGFVCGDCYGATCIHKLILLHYYVDLHDENTVYIAY